MRVLYGSQPQPSHVSRLIAIQRRLGPSVLSILVDHKDHLLILQGFLDAGLPWPKIFIEIGDKVGESDGVRAQSNELEEIINAIAVAEKVQSQVLLRGLFCHGLAYDKEYITNRPQGLKFLHSKINNTIKAAGFTRIKTGQTNRPFILSVGASPTARGTQNILNGGVAGLTSAATSICGILVIAKREDFTVEICNAPYPFYDVQQLILDMSFIPKSDHLVPYSNIATTVLTEVIGVYPSQYPLGFKVHIAAGTDILGYDQDVYYESHGILSKWTTTGKCFVDVPCDHRRSVYSPIMGRSVSGQHLYSVVDTDELAAGKRVRVAPSQGSQVGRALGWYYAVDSGREGKEDEVVDIWVRWRDY